MIASTNLSLLDRWQHNRHERFKHLKNKRDMDVILKFVGANMPFTNCERINM